MRIETSVIKHLIYSDDYLRKVLPFLKAEYFTENVEKVLFNEIDDFTNKYNHPPTIEALSLALGELRNISEDEIDTCENYLKDIEESKSELSDVKWLVDKTEKFCQEKAVYNAILSSIAILDSKDKTKDKGAIPSLLNDALSVSFDKSVGHDYLEDSTDRFDYYHREDEKIPFDLDMLNLITKGGVPSKTLSLVMGGPGSGKSLFLCHTAATMLARGKNVLYITLEMSENEISKRIDANLMDVTIDALMALSKEAFDKKVSRVKKNTTGELVVKEYPTASASTIHFRSLLNELNIKKSFKPDVILVDYLNICCSARVKPGANVNSYTYVKSIAEELRGLAVEFDVPIFSATQLNRTGATSSDPGMEDVSESFGIAATVDFLCALVTSEELESNNQLMIKQVKNRFGDLNYYKRFIVGIDKSKMRLYNTEQSAQSGITDSGQDNQRQARPEKKQFSGFNI